MSNILAKLTFALFCICFVGCKPVKKTNATKQKPNIVFIMTDDHSLSAISAYGKFLSKVAPTPNIDRIAQEGIRFNNMFCSNSICGPSRATIITGKYSHVNGFYKNEGGGDFDGSQQTFPKLLQKSGYQTAVIGKWHLGTSPTGFDYYKVLYNKEGQGSYYNPVFETTGSKLVTETGKYSTNVIKHDAVSWLKNSRDKNKPFMLMYQFKAPHRPWEPGPGYEDYLEQVAIPHPKTYDDDYHGRTAAKEAWMRIDGHMNRKDVKIKAPKGLSEEELNKWNSYGNKDGEFWTPDANMSEAERKEWKYQRYLKDYLRCVKAVDDAVGEMLNYLDESGLSENTIVVYTSDQGFYVGEHGWFDKRFMYEESFHMPLLIRYPNQIKAGQVSDELLTNVDFAPTLLELTGTSIPKDIQGKSFSPLLLGNQKGSFRDEVYYHYYEYPFWHHVQPHYGIRTSQYKLIHYYYDVDNWELFDLEKDPNELHNLYKNQDYGIIIEDLKTRLTKLKAEVGMHKSDEALRKMTDARIPRLYKKEPAN